MLKSLIKITPIKRYNQNVCSGLKYLCVTQLRHLAEQKTITNDKKPVNSDVSAKFSAEQKEKMLKIINNYSLDELLGYDISKASAMKLLAWRNSNGLLANINEMFFVEGVPVKAVDKFFQSLMLEPQYKKKDLRKSAKTSTFIIPAIDEVQRQTIKTCLSVRIGINSIGWCCLNVPVASIKTPWFLTQWEHHEISEHKLHLNELIQRCLYIYNLMPTADCYLFENPQTVQASKSPGSVEQQNINIQKSQVTAVIGYALASRYSQDNNESSQLPPSIFYVRRLLSARLFNHLVGNETVSTEDTILNLMKNEVKTNEQQLNKNFLASVQFPAELRQMFLEAPRYQREFLGQTLLLNLTFVLLVLLKDSQSIAIVVSSNKTKTAK